LVLPARPAIEKRRAARHAIKKRQSKRRLEKPGMAAGIKPFQGARKEWINGGRSERSAVWFGLWKKAAIAKAVNVRYNTIIQALATRRRQRGQPKLV
jgi:hypothetical protein